MHYSSSISGWSITSSWRVLHASASRSADCSDGKAARLRCTPKSGGVWAVRDDGVPRGRLVIGSLETTAALRLAPLLAAYVRACPEVDLTLRTGTTCKLVEAVRKGTVDGAFVCGPVVDPELDSRSMFTEELALV